MRILMPLPDRDFDVTEVAVPWRLLTDAGHQVVFSTERTGTRPEADPRLLSGVIFGQLGAEAEPKRFYQELVGDPGFAGAVAWEAIEPSDYDGLLLAGGHAPGMRQYLGSALLHAKVAEFWKLERPVASICHGPIVLARAGVLAGRRTTCLPKYMERTAYYATAWKLGGYYRTYPAYVEDEVRGTGASFERGPISTARGTATDDGPAFVVQDGNYLSARWPGDAYLFARRFDQLLTT